MGLRGQVDGLDEDNRVEKGESKKEGEGEDAVRMERKRRSRGKFKFDHVHIMTEQSGKILARD